MKTLNGVVVKKRGVFWVIECDVEPNNYHLKYMHLLISQCYHGIDIGDRVVLNYESTIKCGVWYAKKRP